MMSKCRFGLKVHTKRPPPRTLEEFRELAERHRVLDLYDKALVELRPLFDTMNRTRTNIALIGYMGENKARNVILSIYPEASTASNGLAIMIFMGRAREYFNLSSDKLQAVLGPPAKNASTYDPNKTFYFDEQHLLALIRIINEAKHPSPNVRVAGAALAIPPPIIFWQECARFVPL